MICPKCSHEISGHRVTPNYSDNELYITCFGGNQHEDCQCNAGFITKVKVIVKLKEIKS